MTPKAPKGVRAWLVPHLVCGPTLHLSLQDAKANSKAWGGGRPRQGTWIPDPPKPRAGRKGGKA